MFKIIFDKDNDSRIVFSLILCGAAVVLVFIIPLLPAKKREENEERKRELKRIEGQDDSSMNKAEVELHENLKDLKLK